MKLSIIIPVYNAEAYLDRCLSSIGEHDDVEIIAIDDRSTDNSLRILNRSKVHIYSNGTNLGVSVARNKGISIATGDYITFLDADDFMTPDAYDQIVAAIKEDPKAPIIQLNHRRRYPNGHDYLKFYNRCGTYGLDKLPDFWVGVWNKVYKASFIKDIRFLPGLNHGEDELFNLTCLSVARTIYCSDRIHMVHCSDNPQSLSKTVKVEDLIAEQRALLNFAEYHADDGELLDAVRQRQAYLWDNKAYKETFSAKPKM